MREIENLLQPHIGMSLIDYLNSSRMAIKNDKVWGTDIEILAACSLLKTDIYTYTKVGDVYKWNKFSISMLNGSAPENDCAIYINHTNGVHYDIVLDVGIAFYNNNSINYEKQDKEKYRYKDEMVFSAADCQAQGFMCSLVDLPLISKHSFEMPKKPLTTPTKFYYIQGDGNCLFRALSYAVTGRQVYHASLRHKIVNHMREIENLLQPHIGMSLIDYLNSSRMAIKNDKVWGTDIEILAACSLLKTDIYTYNKVGDVYKWNKLNGSAPENDCAIYINHTNGVHYDIVLDVSVDFYNNIRYVEKNRKRKYDSQRSCEYISTHQSLYKRTKKVCDVEINKSSINMQGNANKIVENFYQPQDHDNNNEHNGSSDVENNDVDTSVVLQNQQLEN